MSDLPTWRFFWATGVHARKHSQALLLDAPGSLTLIEFAVSCRQSRIDRPVFACFREGVASQCQLGMDLEVGNRTGVGTLRRGALPVGDHGGFAQTRKRIPDDAAVFARRPGRQVHHVDAVRDGSRSRRRNRRNRTMIRGTSSLLVAAALCTAVLTESSLGQCPTACGKLNIS